jgi:phosphopantetheinyl transferase
VVSEYGSGARVLFRAGRRPLVVGSPLRVSLARAPGLALVGVATSREVGVDVEPVRPAPPDSVAAQLLSGLEAEALSHCASGERDLAFVRAWVRKEAALKAAGVGLAVEPCLVEVGVEPDGPGVVTVPGRGRLRLSDVDVDGHVAAVAAVGTAPVRVIRFDRDGLGSPSAGCSAPPLKHLPGRLS